MKRASAIIIFAVMIISTHEASSQETGDLISNPTIGGFSAAPIVGSRIVRLDTMPAGWTPPETTHRHSFTESVERPYRPAGALIKGMVPDPYRGWAVAVTRDRKEFERALPEYRRLISEGRTREARDVLHVSTDVNVSTKVERYRDREKIGELPEKAGSFFFTLSTHEFEKYGGYLTFLSYTPDPDDPIPVVGKDIGEKIHGILQVEKTEGKEGFEFSYGMDVILADVTE